MQNLRTVFIAHLLIFIVRLPAEKSPDVPELRNAGAKGTPEFPEAKVLSNLASTEDRDGGGYPQPFVFRDICEPAHFERRRARN
jgi:hypothetical protein